MQPFLSQKHLQPKIIITINIMIVIIGVPMFENNLSSVDGQKVGVDDLILVKVLFMLNKDMCVISCIL